MGGEMRIDHFVLADFVARIFEAAACDEAESARVGLSLVGANLAGHDSHGVIRVPRYIAWLESGVLQRGQTITIVSEGPAHASLHGNSGFGQTIGPLAVDFGLAKARAAGVAVVGLRNAGHLGRIGEWGERAAEAGMVAIHFVNVANGAIVAPFGGVERMFATNPVCIAVPSADGPPIVLDFATSLVAEGKAQVAAAGGKPLPPGALVGPDGRLSADPALLYGPLDTPGVREPGRGPGALRPFGEHKGSGLAFMCEILAACLTGGATSAPVDRRPGRRVSNGMLSIYLDPAHFAGAGFAAAVAGYAGLVAASRPAVPGGTVLLPGEAERRTCEQRMREGVPLQADTWERITAVARRLGVPLPAA